MSTFTRKSEDTGKIVSLSRNFYDLFPMAHDADKNIVKNWTTKKAKKYNFTMVQPQESGIDIDIRDDLISHAISGDLDTCYCVCAALFVEDIGQECIEIPRFRYRAQFRDEWQRRDKDMFLRWFGEILDNPYNFEYEEVELSEQTLRVSHYVLKVAALYQAICDYVYNIEHEIPFKFDKLRYDNFDRMMQHIEDAKRGVFTYPYQF